MPGWRSSERAEKVDRDGKDRGAEDGDQEGGGTEDTGSSGYKSDTTKKFPEDSKNTKACLLITGLKGSAVEIAYIFPYTVSHFLFFIDLVRTLHATFALCSAHNRAIHQGPGLPLQSCHQCKGHLLIPTFSSFPNSY